MRVNARIAALSDDTRVPAGERAGSRAALGFPPLYRPGTAGAASRARALRRGAKGVGLEGVRWRAEKIGIVERIVLPRALFPGIEKLDLPNNLYELYRSEFGVTTTRAAERLKAVAASRREARH